MKWLVVILALALFGSASGLIALEQGRGKPAIPKPAAVKKGVKKEEPSKPEPSVWMKQKLSYAQKILNGLAKEDYKLIHTNATRMLRLNKVEYFVRQKPEGYRTQLKTFQFSVDELIRTAKAKNLDGATLAFTQLTISCVNCHKVLRGR